MPSSPDRPEWSRYRLLRLRLTGAETQAPVAVARPRRHVVISGDSLWTVARAYGVDVEAPSTVNALTTDHLRVGQVLHVPVAGRRPSAVTAKTPRPVRLAFAWPARGVLTSRFGTRWRRHHNGIDLAAPRGTPVLATRDGVVRVAGWMDGYGKLVVVGHEDGKESYYGHASAICVRRGQVVERGQRIAAVGCTGACTGSHLHFEIRVGGDPVDPLPYLL
ncbi:MAG: LysM peptidoglycan-binding domain-containing M23 family metallopeptidase [Armatimonadetes bacterium]|nr:LysM peptidoglycan-binding domain-containing M23 family metallopeptidase [Armatimonadota bacterium]